MKQILSVLIFCLGAVGALACDSDQKQCQDYLNARTSASRDEVERVCRQGVNIDCVQYLNSRSSADTWQSAKHCAGNVTVKCIEDKYSRSSLSITEAADWCAGRLP